MPFQNMSLKSNIKWNIIKLYRIWKQEFFFQISRLHFELIIKVNLRRITKVTAIATQGRQDNPQWVTSYKICYGRKLDGYCELLDQVI